MADAPRRARHFKTTGQGAVSATGEPCQTRGRRAAHHTAPSGNTTSAPGRAVGFQPAIPPQDGMGRMRSARRPDGSHVNHRPRARGVSRVVSNVLILVGLVLIVAAASMLVRVQAEYKAQDQLNTEQQAHVIVTDDSQTAPVVDWQGLGAMGGDPVGWVQVPGTVINYPVYQGSDNNQYLRHTVTGEYSIGGQIFMDYENARPGLVDMQTLIYGHHLNNGGMFAAVDEFCDQSFFDQHNTVWYITEQASYQLVPVLIYRTRGDDSSARTINFSSADEFHSYLSGLLDRAAAHDAHASAAVASASHVLTLSTCDYEVAGVSTSIGGRALLVCVPLEDYQAAVAATQS